MKEDRIYQLNQTRLEQMQGCCWSGFSRPESESCRRKSEFFDISGRRSEKHLDWNLIIEAK